MEQIMSIICTVGALLLLLLIGYLRMRGNVKEWLLWAVTQAEQYLGSGTGALKLRYVYDLAVEAFPQINSIYAGLAGQDLQQKYAECLPTLELMREQIKNNPHIKNFVNE